MSQPVPITQVFPQLQHALTQSNQIVLQAPTGAGKSTALPLAMLSWPQISGKIILLEPRRIAARAIARYLAKQLGESVGETVGLRVRGETKVSKQTRLEVVTEGVLTRQIQADPELDGVQLVLFDEVHERHLATDLALALALEVQGGLRDDLTLMLMSATLEGQALEQCLPDAVKVESEGRSYPVTLEYRPVAQGQFWLEATVSEVLKQLSQREGNLLVFLPGQGEIRRAETQLLEKVSSEVMVCPLYGQLSPKQQDAAIDTPPPGKRKVVLATNIAESSLTIDGISVVVDAGWQRQARYNLKSGISRLETVRISQSSAAQRSGRAGRLMAGHGVRMWSESMQQGLASADAPEITQADLTSLALELAAWGCRNADELVWLTLPATTNMTKAWQLLTQLELVDDSHKLTALGRQVHKLGSDPRLGHMLLKAKVLESELEIRGLQRLACELAALLEENDPLRGRNLGIDIDLRLGKLPHTAKAQSQKWAKQLGCQTDSIASGEYCGLLLALAYPDRIGLARGQGGRYQLSGGSGACLPQDDPWCGLGRNPSSKDETLLVCASLSERQGQGDAIVHMGAQIPLSELQDALPYLFRWQRFQQLSPKNGELIAERQLQLGALVVRREPLTDLSDDDYVQALLQAVRQQGLGLLPFTDNINQWRFRVAHAKALLTQGDWPELSDESLLADLSWLEPYLSGVKKVSQLNKLDLFAALKAQLDWSLQSTLEQQLPSHWLAPTGSKLPLEYHESGVKLAVRVQEMYGEAETPRLAQGQLPVTLELLSPARRPLQVTEDLAAFWAGAWNEVKKEMKGRYPKHLWPDDPANTQPTKVTKKRMQQQ
ncbi:ATP-dependent helicase HrpB [Ferrimonas aestuarii]|uniref:ATP-dependent helicase HrpB n=1 Tax=Ferrimonas aestuarii TaxID=2569539 RepID=A0A4U1BQL4_9GAMM|nr:ATP-dependent helicase HrpB [Ferrimonas aestuarii]TKB56706.1 ATP-dependent helicase HrpB [Ferrimonas aestuarii]